MSQPAGAEPAAATAPWRVALAGLQARFAGYEARQDQRQMIEAVASAIDDGRDLIVEAGTGTGKTLAYLLPILSTGRRAIISTATRQLQAQIVQFDLPTAMEATGSFAKVAVLKGRANYLCHDRVERALSQTTAYRRGPGSKLDRVANALRTSPDGDTADLDGIEDSDPFWADVTSTSENCLGSDCAFIRECFVVKARRRAMEADIIIANHYVLLADYALRERYDGAALLPAVDVIVVDEAHGLEDVVARFFGRALSNRRIERLVREVGAALDECHVPAEDGVRFSLQQLGEAAPAFFDVAAALPANQPIGAAAERALAAPREALIAAIGKLWVDLGRVGEANPLHARLRESVVGLEADLLEVAAPRNDESEVVRWVEARGRTVSLHCQPVVVAPILRRTLFAEPARRIFTSATLAVGGDFSAIRSDLGLGTDVDTLCLDGGFDYASQALLYVDGTIPAPFAPGRDEAVAARIGALVAASGGGAFALFSSYRQMQDAHRRLEKKLSMRVLMQGEEGKLALLERFRAGPPTVLFATMGFWQGVDVPGDALRLVILDKIPFPPPDEPRFAARAAALDAMGSSSFRALSIPAAALALRQGFGRLIRRRDDRGVVAILDPRLATKPYGRQLLRALPPAPRTDDLDVVRAFFAASLR